MQSPGADKEVRRFMMPQTSQIGLRTVQQEIYRSLQPYPTVKVENPFDDAYTRLDLAFLLGGSAQALNIRCAALPM